MESESKIRTVYRIEGGLLNGTEIEAIMAFLSVRYPHRKTRDLYIPPMRVGDKETKTWYCCQKQCPTPDFEGGIEALVAHLMLHKGKLVKPWNKRLQLKSPLPTVYLPPNPWNDKPKGGVNEDRRFCLDLYIEDVRRALRKQGLEII